MANETLVINKNDARMTVIGKSWPDEATDSGGGEWYPIPTNDLPVRIAVTTPPTKTEYNDGEWIDFSGMVVTAYDENGDVWTNAEYPDGTIPFNELDITPRKAINALALKKYGDFGGYPLYYTGYSRPDVHDTILEAYESPPIFTKDEINDVVNHQGRLLKNDLFSISPSRVGVYILQNHYTTYNSAGWAYGDAIIHYSRTRGKDGDWYSPGNVDLFFFGYRGTTLTGAIGLEKSTPPGMTSPMILLTISPELVNKTRIIWQRPGDGQILETSLEITVSGEEQS